MYDWCFYIKNAGIKSKTVKIRLFCIALRLCVFTACGKDGPVVPPTEQPGEPETPVEPEEPDTPRPAGGSTRAGIGRWDN